MSIRIGNTLQTGEKQNTARNYLLKRDKQMIK